MRIAALLLLVAGPRFSPDRVLPANSDRRIALEPGMIMSIYGEDLGPSSGCVGYADRHQAYPNELCGVQVTVGGRFAGLLYVSAKQINFKVPQETGIEGTAELRVIYQGQSSAPAALPLGLEKTRVFLDRPAYVGMPVWLQIELPLNLTGTIQYPYVLGPAGLGCNKVEVRRKGITLKQIPEADWFKRGGVFSGNPCGSYSLPGPPGKPDRLPIHLLYRFDTPGIYEVRFNQSDWTPIEILPAQSNQRAALFAEARANLPTDAGAILSDFLPGILGFPDDQSFQIVAGYLYHPFQGVRRYAQLALSYWPDELVRSRLLELLKSKGPSDEIVYRLTSGRDFLRAHSSEIIRASLKYVDSDSMVLSQGAVRGIGAVPLHEADPAAAREVIDAAEQANGEKEAAYIGALGTSRDPRAHRLLWKLQGQGIGGDRIYFSIALFRDPEDLPKLGAALNQPGHGRGEIDHLPYYLHSNFGDAALPYLETAVANSPYTFVRTNSAEELVNAGRPSGFAFIADAIKENRKYRQELIQFLRDRFPELRNAADARLLAFLTEKSASGIPHP